ncbi:hypothetical protein BC826DRAFT_1017017 [Russula brevipes]|nr:hypothetical protein BC826DRAFT_1017017 [Russula brevipes]
MGRWHETRFPSGTGEDTHHSLPFAWMSDDSLGHPHALPSCIVIICRTRPRGGSKCVREPEPGIEVSSGVPPGDMRDVLSFKDHPGMSGAICLTRSNKDDIKGSPGRARGGCPRSWEHAGPVACEPSIAKVRCIITPGLGPPKLFATDTC